MNRKQLLIKEVSIVNEGSTFIADLLIANGIIVQIGSIPVLKNHTGIPAKGLHLLPGVIDSHVHFREPGLTHQGDIFSESRAAVAGGIASFIEMPNTVPNVLTQQIAADKFNRAAKYSFANYSFYMGSNPLAECDQVAMALYNENPGRYFSGFKILN
ncbi:hypothetical protein BH11BAC4_BH11BAC4_08630 [soil metagenome]